jgi:hypothetical protein
VRKMDGDTPTLRATSLMRKNSCVRAIFTGRFRVRALAKPVSP